jgi:RimJ/RimL family protein N-acetyltransferase
VDGKATHRPGLISIAYRLTWEGRLFDLASRVGKRIYSETIAYGLRRDLQIPFPSPAAKIPISVRKLVDCDVPILLPDESTLDSRTSWEIRTRRAQHQTQIPQCYVAVDERARTPCYFQWLMGPSHNAEIQSFFEGSFPVLGPDEALLEGAYTPPQYRGMGIMAAAMAQIAERALQFNARYVITFVASDNVPSLKGCVKAGFVPYVERRTRHLVLAVRHSFTILPTGFLMPYQRAESRKATASVAQVQASPSL